MEELVRFLFEKSGIAIPEGALKARQEAGQEYLSLNLKGDAIQRLLAGDARRVRDFRVLLSAAAAVKKTRVSLEINEAA